MSPKVLVACEFSGAVRGAFRALGYEAWSCDLLPAEDNGPHIQGDVREVLGWGWTLLIAHPPCTHLAVSGARWFKDKLPEQAEALAFVRTLMDAPVPHIAIENPVSIISSRVRKPDQTVQPWWFGHGETPLPGLTAGRNAAGRFPALPRPLPRSGASFSSSEQPHDPHQTRSRRHDPPPH